MLVRCSSLGKIMTKPREKGQVLSVGAKTYIETLAKAKVYSFTPSFTSKEVEKGKIVEPESIKLINEVLFADFTKNTEQRTNRWISGTPDIVSDSIHDVKSPWSLNTFPALPKDGEDAMYEWQLRGYMMLWDLDYAELDYALVDTPDELIGFESEELHKVSHIAPELRLTRVFYERDRNLESFIEFQVTEAQRYFADAVQAILAVHG